MPTYAIQNRWGGESAPWRPSGVFVLGARDAKPQNVVSLDVTSPDGGETLVGKMTYKGEGHIAFRGTLVGNNNYTVENRWGGEGAPWHPGGTWVLGFRENQNVVAVNISSDDDGETFTGKMTYSGEGPIGLKASQVGTNVAYRTENQWGGDDAPWHVGGIFVLGNREKKNVVRLELASDDGGKSLNGRMHYQGEGPIAFRATLSGASTYVVENRWGGSQAPWHPGGTWIIGYRGSDQNVVALEATSDDGGETLAGTLTYQNEGPIGFKASQLCNRATEVEAAAQPA